MKKNIAKLLLLTMILASSASVVVSARTIDPGDPIPTIHLYRNAVGDPGDPEPI